MTARPDGGDTREPDELREALEHGVHQAIQEASWARGVAMLDSDVAAFRDAVLALPAVAELLADRERPLPTAPDGGTYAHHCRDATCSAAYTWVLIREGDAVTSWACDRHLAAACDDLQRENGRETRIYVDRIRRALDGEA
ncbi:MAG: hypothetical protein JWO67_4556 [Streptosporangiaceae bacterium]|nr:hypothetical protein [Streptosporangiaceae bacterium]